MLTRSGRSSCPAYAMRDHLMVVVLATQWTSVPYAFQNTSLSTRPYRDSRQQCCAWTTMQEDTESPCRYGLRARNDLWSLNL